MALLCFIYYRVYSERLAYDDGFSPYSLISNNKILFFPPQDMESVNN